MKGILLFVVLSTLLIGCFSSKQVKSLGRLPSNFHTLWQSDFCGNNGYRIQWMEAVVDCERLLSTKDKVDNWLGVPNKVMEFEEGISYFYIVDYGAFANCQDTIVHDAVMMSLSISFDHKQKTYSITGALH